MKLSLSAFILSLFLFTFATFSFVPFILAQSSTAPAPELYLSEGSSMGGLVSLSTTEEPAIELRAWGNAGKAQITIFESSEDFLLRYLVHDKEGKQTSVPDSSGLKQVATFEYEVKDSNGSNNRVTLPLQGSGIWYAKIKLNNRNTDLMIVRSKIGAVVRKSDTKLIIWGQHFETKRKLDGAQITAYTLENQQSEQTNQALNGEGFTEVSFTPKTDILTIKKDGETAIVPINLKHLNTGYGYSRFQPRSLNPRHFTFTDRPIYGPGNTVYFKSIIRDDDDGRYSIPQGNARVQVFKDWERKNILFEKIYPVSAQGSVHGEFSIPKDAATGYYTLEVKMTDLSEDFSGHNSQTAFQVEHYRKPEYTLDITTQKREVLRSEEVALTIEGNYFSGQPLAGQTVKYSIGASDTYEYEYFSSNANNVDTALLYGGWSNETLDSGNITLDENGKAVVILSPSKYPTKGKTQIYFVEATFNDATGNPVYSKKNFIVYPGYFSIFRKESQYTGKVNQKYTLPLQLVGRENISLSNLEIVAKVEHNKWEPYQDPNQKHTQYREVKKTLPELRARSNGQGEAELQLTPTETGSYTISVTGKDQKGNEIKKDFFVWVIGENEAWYQAGSSSKITMSTNKSSYLPEESVRVTIFSEVPDRDVFLSLQRNRVDRYQLVSIQGKTATVDIPLKDVDMPHTNIRVGSFGEGVLDTAMTKISVSPNKKKITVTIESDKKNYGPGEIVTLNVSTKDQFGNPVPAEVAVWSVDKAIFELANAALKDIFKTYWEERFGFSPEAHSLEGINVNTAEGGGGCFLPGTKVLMADGSVKNIENVKVGDMVLTRKSEEDATLVASKVTSTHKVEVNSYLAINQDLLVTENHLIWVNGGWQEAGSIQVGDILKNIKNEDIKVTSVEWLQQKTPVHNLTIENQHTYFANGTWVHNEKGESRSVFKDTAYWNPSVQTDNTGQAQVRFKTPDNLTTWVIAGVASTTDTKVGQNTTEIQVSKDIVVRPVLPNILRVNDQVELSAIVHNFSDQDQTFDIDLSFTAGKVENATFSAKTIKAKSSEQVFWHVHPSIEEEATLHFRALGQDRANPKTSDEIIVKLPVEKFGFTEKRTRVSTTATTLPITIEADSDLKKSGYTLSIASNLLGTLPTGMKYLIEYPYGCVEQTTSKFVPAVLAQADPALFQAALDGKDLKEIIRKGVERLSELQQTDGGWAWWYSTGSDPFVTAYVSEYLVTAKNQGAIVPEKVLNEAQSFLKRTNRYNPRTQQTEPDDFATRVVKHYGLSFFNDEQSKQPLTTNPDDYKNLSTDVLSMAVLLNAKNGNRDTQKNGLAILMSRAEKEGESLFWAAAPSAQFGSKDASTALALRAILAGGGNRDDAVRASRFLLNNRKAEYWSNTFATANVLRSVLDLVKTGDELTPSYTYRVLLNGKELKKESVYSAKQVLSDIKLPLQDIGPGSHELVIEKQGEGQIYTTLVEKEFRTSLDATSKQNQISLTREYVSDKGAEHSLAVGDTVTVNLTVEGLNTEEQYAVIEDQLPAGLIPINIKLNNERGQDNNGSNRPSYLNGVSDTEVTKNGIILSLYKVPSGKQTFSYKARVISAGNFLVPPAHMELMYAPEIFANTRPSMVKVTPQSEFISSPIEAGATYAATLASDLLSQPWVRYALLSVIGLSVLSAGSFFISKHYQKKAETDLTQNKTDDSSDTPENT